MKLYDLLQLSVFVFLCLPRGSGCGQQARRPFLFDLSLECPGSGNSQGAWRNSAGIYRAESGPGRRHELRRREALSLGP